jgi:hypothetical protein
VYTPDRLERTLLDVAEAASLSDDPSVSAAAASFLYLVFSSRRQWNDALRACRVAVSRFQEIGNAQEEGLNHLNLFSCFVDLGLLGEALTSGTDLLQKTRLRGIPYLECVVLANIGLVQCELGDHHEALTVARTAVALADAQDLVRVAVYARTIEARAAMATKDHARASSLLTEALSAVGDNVELRSFVLATESLLCLSLGDVGSAVQKSREAQAGLRPQSVEPLFVWLAVLKAEGAAGNEAEFVAALDYARREKQSRSLLAGASQTYASDTRAELSALLQPQP